MDFMDKVKKLDADLAEIEARSGAKKADDDKYVEEVVPAQNMSVSEPQMTAEQAKAILEIAKSPKDFIGTKVSAAINDLIDHNDDFKEKIEDIAEDTTMAGIETFSTSNKKQRKANYFDLNEKDIAPMGGGRTSSKGQQVSIVVMRRFFWMVIMATLGFFYIAPLTIMVELFQGLSFKTIEKEQVVSNGERKVKHFVTRTKLGKAGSIIGFVLGLLLDVAVAAGNVFYPLVYVQISLVVFATLLGINVWCGFDMSRLKRATKKEKQGEDETSSNATIEVEEED